MKKKRIFIGLALLSAFALTSCGEDVHTPEITIGENGNWYVDGVDQGVQAKGEKGDNGTDGQNGLNGVSVISISKTKTQANVDTYTILFSNNTTSTFTVTNGIDGEEGNDGNDADPLTVNNVSIKSSVNNIDTYEIEFSDGYKTTFTVTNGVNGEKVSVKSISKESTDGKYDTYKISFSDDTYQTFVIKNGEDGLTPYIGDNGNWWIGNQDTGVIVDYNKVNNVQLTIFSSGLRYQVVTYGDVTGYIVTGWDANMFASYAKETLSEEEYNAVINLDNYKDSHLVIPNYVGNVPVIGIDREVELNFNKVTLSSNTIFLGAKAFYNCSRLKEVDFNNSKITYIPEYCFYKTSLEAINLPETVTHVYDYAFDGVSLREFNIDNLKYIGNYAFDDAYIDYIYLPKTIEYVGKYAFDSTFVYVENETIPTSWDEYFTQNQLAIATNVKNNGEYLYKIDNNEATLYQYLGDEKKLTIPATIDNKPITTIGSGFSSYIYDTSSLNSMTYLERYEYFNNVGGIEELIIGNNVKKIERYALMKGNMFIFVGKNVEEIEMNDGDGLIGLFYDSEPDDGDPFSLVVLEDASKIKYTFSETNIKTYDELLAYNDDYELLFKTNISYDDIYYDEDNKTYYAKDTLSYELIACKASFVDTITVLDSIGLLPVKTIGKYAFEWVYADKIKIGNKVNKIKPYAFYGCKTSLFIPKNVEIINANAIKLNSNSTIYAEVSQKSDDWDTNWNPNNTSVVYSISKSEFDNMVITDDYVGVIKSDNTIKLVKYKGSYGNNCSINIPRTIAGRTVTSIASGFLKITYSYNNLRIYIPSTVKTIESKGIDLYQSYYYASIYLEAESVPDTFETNWYYNSYTSSTGYISCYTGQNIDY